MYELSVDDAAIRKKAEISHLIKGNFISYAIDCTTLLC